MKYLKILLLSFICASALSEDAPSYNANPQPQCIVSNNGTLTVNVLLSGNGARGVTAAVLGDVTALFGDLIITNRNVVPFTNNAAFTTTNTLVVGTNAVHSTNQFQVATPTVRAALEVDTNGVVYSAAQIRAKGRVNASYTDGQSDFIDAGNFFVGSSTSTGFGMRDSWIISYGGTEGAFWMKSANSGATPPRLIFGGGSRFTSSLPISLLTNLPAIFTQTNATPRLTIIAGDGTNKCDLVVSGTISATNGFTSYTNALTINSFTFPATTVNWTNPVHVAIEVYIDATAVTGTSIKKNGTQIYGGLSNDVSIGLRDGEYFSMTYSVGTPVGTWGVFP